MTVDIVCDHCGIVMLENMDPCDPRVDQLAETECPHCGGNLVLQQHEDEEV